MRHKGWHGPLWSNTPHCTSILQLPSTLDTHNFTHALQPAAGILSEEISITYFSHTSNGISFGFKVWDWPSLQRPTTRWVFLPPWKLPSRTLKVYELVTAPAQIKNKRDDLGCQLSGLPLPPRREKQTQWETHRQQPLTLRLRAASKHCCCTAAVF